VIGINPFDQPDVEASKIKTRELTEAFEKFGKSCRTSGRCAPMGRWRFSPTKTTPRRCARARRWQRRQLAQGAFIPSWRRRLRSDPRLPRPRRSRRREPAAVAAGAARSPPRRDLASNSARAFCIRRGKPTRAGPTAACSSKSHRMTPRPRHSRPPREFWRGQSRASARRFRRSARTRPPRATYPSHGDLKSGLAALEAAVQRTLA